MTTRERESNNTQIRIVLVDDHAVVREGLKSLLHAQPDMQIVGEAGDGTSALDLIKNLSPQVLIMDISMPGISGAELAEHVSRERPDVKMLALTLHEERSYVSRLMRAGICGYVLKRAPPVEMVNAVRIVAGGGTYIDPLLSAHFVANDETSESWLTDDADRLSDREREVLVRTAKGFSNKEMASSLGLSTKTVETYKARIAEKLGLRSRVEIVRFASRHGWLREEE